MRTSQDTRDLMHGPADQDETAFVCRSCRSEPVHALSSEVSGVRQGFCFTCEDNRDFVTEDAFDRENPAWGGHEVTI